MNKIDLNKTTLRELNSKLHQSKENEKWLVTNPKGNHAIAVGLDNFTAKPMAWGNQAKAELKRGNLDFKGNQGDGSKHNKVAMRLNTHPTVKPQELMKYLCRLVTPKGGVVLDPFMGSGSTGMAAKDEGFDFIGIEKEKEYFEIAEARIKVSSPLMEFM